MKVFYTEGTTFITPKAPTRAEGDKSGLCVETLGAIHIRGDNSDPDNIQSDQVQYWYSMPDDMDISDTFTGEDQVPVVYPDATKIAEALATTLKAAGITEVLFDRNGYVYHGVVKAFADALRANEIKL